VAKNNPAVLKRDRERKRAERAADKRAERERRSAERSQAGGAAVATDEDLAGYGVGNAEPGSVRRGRR
jgi:hypothetical protein